MEWIQRLQGYMGDIGVLRGKLWCMGGYSGVMGFTDVTGVYWGDTGCTGVYRRYRGVMVFDGKYQRNRAKDFVWKVWLMGVASLKWVWHMLVKIWAVRDFWQNCPENILVTLLVAAVTEHREKRIG